MNYVTDIIIRANFEAADQSAANQIAEEIANSIVGHGLQPHQIITSSRTTHASPIKPGPEDQFHNRGAHSTIEVEGALCAWEWLLDQADTSPYKEMFEGVGSSGLRFVSMQAGQICVDTYAHMEAMSYEFEGSYDWEFVPAVLALLDWDALIKDNQWGGPAYEPNIDEIFTAMFAVDKARRAPDQRRFSKNETLLAPLDRWLERARIEAKKQWAYAELIDDHIDRAHQAHKAEQDPADFVKWLGEKYDLTPASDWSYA